MATLTARGYVNRYQYTDYLVYQPDQADFRDVGDSTWYGGEVRGLVRLLDHGRLSLTVGGEVTVDDVQSHSFSVDHTRDTTVPTRFDVEGLYAEAESSPLGWLSLVGGMRLDVHSKFETNLSPRGALFLHRGDEYGLKLLFAEGFRYPSPFEAFFQDMISYTANPRLTPERIRSFEGVLWSRPLRGLNLRASGFRWDMEDLIEQEELASGMLQYQNSFSLASTGAELEGSYRDTRGWLAFASTTFAVVTRCARSNPSDLSSPTTCGKADDTFNSPQVVGTAGVSTPELFHFHFSNELVYLSGRATRDPMVGVASWLGWNIVAYAPNLHGFDLTLAMRNVLGTRDRLPVSQDFDRPMGANIYVLPSDGRELYARLGFSY
jgi:outer membrane receptor protein involved in Fe transport